MAHSIIDGDATGASLQHEPAAFVPNDGEVETRLGQLISLLEAIALLNEGDRDRQAVARQLSDLAVSFSKGVMDAFCGRAA